MQGCQPVGCSLNTATEDDLPPGPPSPHLWKSRESVTSTIQDFRWERRGRLAEGHECDIAGNRCRKCLGGTMMLFNVYARTHVCVYSVVRLRYCFFLLKLLEHLKSIADGRGENAEWNILMAYSWPVDCPWRPGTNEAHSSFVLENIIITHYTRPSALEFIGSSTKANSNTKWGPGKDGKTWNAL